MRDANQLAGADVTANPGIPSRPFASAPEVNATRSNTNTRSQTEGTRKRSHGRPRSPPSRSPRRLRGLNALSRQLLFDSFADAEGP